MIKFLKIVGITIIALVASIIALVASIILIIYIRATIIDYRYEEVENNIDYEYLGKVKIIPEIDEVLDEYLCMYLNKYSNKIGSEQYYNYPRLFVISDEEDIDYYEVVFDTNINIELDFSRGRLYMTAGSEIDSFDIQGWLPEEIPGDKIEKYDVHVRFKDEFDGNMIYFYWLETDDFGYSDH